MTCWRPIAAESADYSIRINCDLATATVIPSGIL
jgi:hypothetical protein